MDNEKPVPISFWLSGLHCNSTDGEVVCPAWMVPPSEVAHPTLVLGQDDAVNMFKEIKFKGVPILYSTTFLKFNDEEETPVVVKRIGDKIYAVLVREHLPHVETN